MSYTNQTIEWLRMKSEPDLNEYGDQVYKTKTLKIKARKQPTQTLVRTSTGREVVSKTVYYIDPKITPEALSIERLDKLDGELVEEVYIMNDLMGKPKMIKVLTV